MPQTNSSPIAAPALPDGRKAWRILHVHADAHNAGCTLALRRLAPMATIIDCTTPAAVLTCLNALAIDLVLLESRSHGDDAALIRSIRRAFGQEALPILVAAQSADLEGAFLAFRAGANDCLIPPFDADECGERCRRALEHRMHYLCSLDLIAQQELRIAHVTEQLRLREAETLLTLARAANHRDHATGAHLRRMAKYAFIIAAGSGLTAQKAAEIELAAPMHDIGKIGIPDEILQNKGALDAQQMRVMQNHTRIGYEILQGSSSSFIQAASVVALHHHEKFNGSGYPMGLEGEAIPIEARVVALADVFDALTSARPYKPAWEWERAVHYVTARSGTEFDPLLVEAFLACDAELRNAHGLLADPPDSLTIEPTHASEHVNS